MTRQTYQEKGIGLSRGAIQGLLPQLKKEHEWLRGHYLQCLQVVALNLSNASSDFFEGRGKFSRFKAKVNQQSISYSQNVKVKTGYIKFPKGLSLRVSRRVYLPRPVKGAGVVNLTNFSI